MQKQQQVSLSKQNIIEQQILQQQLQTDFLTILALATDVQETINYFKQVSDHVMIDIQMNKLILQLNISSMLHCEIVDNIQQSHSQWQQTYLDQTKENYIQFTKYVLANYRFDPIIQGKLSRYVENQLSKHPKMQMEQGKKVNLQKNFDASVAETVIHGIQKSDMQFEKIRNGEKVAEINYDYINQYIQQRQEQAKAGLDLKWRDKKLDKNYINLKN